MTIHVAESGSNGNGYIIDTGTEKLLIECGVHAKDILKMIHFNTLRISGCVVSHKHGDHAAYIREYLKYGFPVCMTRESKVEGATRIIRRMKTAKIGGFSITPFKVPHDDTECDGFYIRHSEIGKLLFITDAEYCPYDLSSQGINHLMIECNYSTEYLEDGSINLPHVLRGHMELETAKRLIMALNNDKLVSVGILHVSTKNGDIDRFTSEIQAEIPNAKVWGAKKGVSVIV